MPVARQQHNSESHCFRIAVYSVYTVSHKITCHVVSDYNSVISWTIFAIFVPVKTEQRLYLMAWWRHNSVASRPEILIRRNEFDAVWSSLPLRGYIVWRKYFSIEKNAKSSITQPGIVRFHWKFLKCLIMWRPTYCKHSRSKGQRSRSQPDVTGAKIC